ncbi:hypothetical protein C5708_14740 [Caulobacter sp. CCUG 60055]|uniref:hypothetical protein n=1 Tax=Caulobacter sp. CCUG 60055 TaxID=2100090 RepID=UPI001FA7FE43|nr:hypothetical protein [Caulobacter sp. CCUG 60055]MBQ1543611.1 hypothetical protein [Caulobacteraceae bacterium]MCI3181510.1 hypothetical protein [Caulobacter sp. CCUG 60055]
MKRFKVWASIVLVAAAVLAGLYAWWSLDLRWRPTTLKKNAPQIAAALQSAGWVSPGLKGPKLYIISYRACEDCILFEKTKMPALRAAGVETRVIMTPRPTRNGVVRSSPAERATIAELWANRSWPLYERWRSVPPDAWKAEGVPPADGDAARTALVKVSEDFVATMTPLLKDNGVALAYPTLIWEAKDGGLHTLAWREGVRYDAMMKELGAG